MNARVRRSSPAADTTPGGSGGDISADASVRPDTDDTADDSVILDYVDPAIPAVDTPMTPDSDAPMIPDADAPMTSDAYMLRRPRMLMVRWP